MPKRRGCIWWTVTLFWVAVFLALVSAYPIFLIPTVIIVGLAIVGYITSKRRIP